jgi:two-component system heavy metal sensor histidine kinase CusS
MRPFSLAAKLGLKVGLMSAALLLLFATFGYLMVGRRWNEMPAVTWK